MAEVLNLTHEVPFNTGELGAANVGDRDTAGGERLASDGCCVLPMANDFQNEEDSPKADEDEPEQGGIAYPTGIDAIIMPPLTAVGGGGSQVGTTAVEGDTGASSESLRRPSSGTRRDDGTGKERKGTVLRRVSDRHRALLSVALIDWREDRAKNLGARSARRILPDREVADVADKVPTTKDELRTVGTWRGTRKLATHGESLLAAITKFLTVNKVALDGDFP